MHYIDAAAAAAATQGALIREAALLRRFQHRHVLLLHTSFVVGRELWMVMPYMDLGSVRSIMRKAWPQVCLSCQPPPPHKP